MLPRGRGQHIRAHIRFARIDTYLHIINTTYFQTKNQIQKTLFFRTSKWLSTPSRLSSTGKPEVAKDDGPDEGPAASGHEAGPGESDSGEKSPRELS